MIRVLCSLLFCASTFAYLYWGQADMLRVAQHVLSEGTTSYSPLVGALLITLVLQALQAGVCAITRLTHYAHAITYLPSMLALGILTDAGPDVGHAHPSYIYITGVVLALLLWLAIVYVARSVVMPRQDKVATLRMVWVNVLTMAVFGIVTAALANTGDVAHYRAKTECLMADGRFAEAAKVGGQSAATDKCLTRLRAFCLAKQGLLGERLFTYPIAGSGLDLLPDSDCPTLLPADSIYKALGAKKGVHIAPSRYLDALLHCGLATPLVKDYILCALLIDRDLDGFAARLPQFYAIGDSLPRHYREALILYTHTRSNPRLVWHSEPMDTDYQDMQALENKEGKEAVYRQYKGTYWWYYSLRN